MKENEKKKENNCSKTKNVHFEADNVVFKFSMTATKTTYKSSR